MASRIVSWNLPGPVVENIFLKCGLKDFLSSRLVCKTWAQSGSGSQFWKKYFNGAIDMNEGDNWLVNEFQKGYYYWDGSVHHDDGEEEEFYHFKAPLIFKKAGFATIEDCDLLQFTDNSEQVIKATHRVLRCAKLFNDAEAYAISESDYGFIPIIFPLKMDQCWDPPSILKALGTHPRIEAFFHPFEWPKGGITEENFEGGGLAISVGCEENRKVVIKELNEYFGEESMIFYAGSEMCNPVPYFLLKEIADGLVGGLVSGLIHT